MADPSVIIPLFMSGSQSGAALWLTAPNLGLYVQQVPVHIQLRALPVTVSYSLISGTLPTGLTLSSTGLISGIMPSLSIDTIYSFVVSAYNGINNSLRRFTLTGTVFVETQPEWQTPAGTIGDGNSSYLFISTLLAIDPNGLEIGYRIISGSLPLGLTLNVSTGVIYGYLPIITQDTTYTFTVNATNGFYVVPRIFSITILLNPTINWQTPAGVITTQRQNTDLFCLLAATSPSGSLVSYIISGGSLPSGCTLDTQSGIISGHLPYNFDAADVDSYSITVTASDGTVSDARGFTIVSYDNNFATDPFAGLYANAVILLMHMDGDNYSKIFIDSTGNNVLNVGNPLVSDVESKFGGGSAYFDGMSRLSVNPKSNHNFDLSATDFTIEFFALFQTLPSIPTAFFQISSNNLVVGYDANSNVTIDYYAANSTTQSSLSYPWTPFPFVWSYLVVVGSNSNIYVWADGQMIGNSLTTMSSVQLKSGGQTTPAQIGSDSAGQFLNGFIDEIRVTRAARYQPDTVIPIPTKPFPDIPYWITPPQLPFGISEYPYSTIFTGNDPNDQGLTYYLDNASTLPLFLDLPLDGDLSGTVLYSPNTITYTFTAFLTDGYNPVEQTFELEIKESLPPNLANTSNLGVYIERYPVSTAINATDPNQLPLTYISVEMPNGLTINSTTGAITGFAPTELVNTTTNVIVDVSNGAQSVTGTYTITFDHDYPAYWTNAIVNTVSIPIANDNSITTIYSAYELTNLPSTIITAIDPNNQPVIYDFIGGTIPPSLTVANTGHISGFLSCVSTTTEYIFTIGASDGYNITPATFAVTIEYCAAPIWQTANGALNAVTPTTTYSTLLTAIDVNTPPLPITYSINSGSLPAGLMLNSASGFISGFQTGVANSTTFNFTVAASNGIKSSILDFSIFVPIDHVIYWYSSGEIANTLTSQPVIATLQAIALDLSTINSYTIVSGTLPAGVTLESVHGHISGVGPPVIANSANVAEYTSFNFVVEAASNTANGTQTLSISIGDYLPTWNLDSVLGTFYGTALSHVFMTAQFAPPISVPLTYSIVSGSAPDLMTLNANSGLLQTSFPDVTTNTVNTFVASATDGINVITRTYVVDIIPSYPPIWITPSGGLINNAVSNAVSWVTPTDLGSFPAEIPYHLILQAETGQYEFDLAAIDPQGFPLTFTVANGSSLPGTLSLGVNGKISGGLLPTDAGSFTVIVDNGLKTNTEVFSITGDGSINTLSYVITGGSPPIGYFANTIVSNVIPNFLEITGTYPAIVANTTYSFIVEASNGLNSNTQTFTIESLYPIPSWITPSGDIFTGLGSQPLSNSNTDVLTVIAYSPVNRQMSYNISNINLLPNTISLQENVFTGALPQVLLDTTYQFVMNATDGFFIINSTFTITAEVNPYLSWITPAGRISTVIGGLPDYYNTSILANSATGIIAYTINGMLPGTVAIANSTPLQGYPLVLTGMIPDSNTEVDYPFTVTATTEAGYTIFREFDIKVLISTDKKDDLDYKDPFANSVVWLMHFDGPDFSGVMRDEILHTVSRNEQDGSMKPPISLSTDRAKYGQSSVYLNGSTAFNTKDAPEFDLSTTDFTLELSLYFEVPQTPLTKTTYIFSCTSFFVTYTNNEIQVNYINNANTFVAKSFSTDFALNTWYSIALQRSSGTLSFFVNGQPAGYYSNGVSEFYKPVVSSYPMTVNGVTTTYYNYWSWPPFVGARQTQGNAGGYLGPVFIDEFRLTRAARYTGQYYVSEYPFPTPPAFQQVAGNIGTVYGGVQAFIPITATDPYDQGLLFTIANGTPPTLMNLLANGLLEGSAFNPTTDTTFTFGVTVTDNINYVTREYSVLDKANLPAVWNTLPGRLGQFVAGNPVPHIQLSAKDPILSSAPIFYELYSGALPPGIMLSNTGVFSGNTTIINNTVEYFFTVTASDGVYPPTPRDFSLNVLGNGPPIWVTQPGNIGTFQSGKTSTIYIQAIDYNSELINYGIVLGNSISYGYQSIANTNGLFFGDFAGMGGIYGASHLAQTTIFDMTFIATNNQGSSTLPVSFTVTSTLSPYFNSNTAVTFTGLGGLAANVAILATDPQNLPLTYAVVTTSGYTGLPPGVVLNATNGQLTGNLPNSPGNLHYTFEVSVTNQVDTVSSEFVYIVNYNFPPIWQTNPNLGSFNGTITPLTIYAIDPEGYNVTYSIVSGSIPPGLSYQQNTLRGTLPQLTNGDVTYTFTLGASDGVTVTPQTFTLTNEYSGVPLFSTSSTLPAAYLNQSYNASIPMKNNLISGTTFVMIGGSLPTGLTFNNGVISGTPTQSQGGTFSIQVSASNSAGTTTATVNLSYLTLPVWNNPSSNTIAQFVPGPSTQSVQVSASSTSGFSITYSLVTNPRTPSNIGGAITVLNSLPPGMSLDPNSGIISGVVIPTSSTENTYYIFTIAAQDTGFNDLSLHTYTIVVNHAAALSSSYLFYGSSNFQRLSGGENVHNIDSKGNTATLCSGDYATYVITTTGTNFPITFVANSSSQSLFGFTLIDNGNGTANFQGMVDQSTYTGTYQISIDANNGYFTSTTNFTIDIFQVSTPSWNNVYNGGDLSSLVQISSPNINIYSLMFPTSGQQIEYVNSTNMVSCNQTLVYPITIFGGNNGFLIPVIQLSLVSGSLPSNLRFSQNNNAYDTDSIIGPTSATISGTIVSGSRGQSYNFTILASITNGPYTWSSTQDFVMNL